MAGQNTHRNMMLSAFTICGDVAIGTLLYIAFCKYKGLEAAPGYLQSVVTVFAIYFACVYRGGVVLYKRNVRYFQVMALVITNVFWFALAGTFLLNVGQFLMLPAGTWALYLLSVAVLSTLFRLSVKKAVVLYRSKDTHTHHVVLVGSYDNMRTLRDEMVSMPYLGYSIDGYFDYKPNPDFGETCPYLGTPADVMTYLAQHPNVHELYCCLESKNRDDIVPIIKYCNNNLVHFFSVPNVSNYLHHRMYMHMMGNVPYLSLYREPLERIENRMVKRLFDILFSLAFLCTLFIPIFIIVTIITKVTMPGPVFFRQKRNGINGKEFYCYKFRSMRVNADADRLQATKDDPRKTKWGNIMRKYSIDELPQFINVLLGDMSVVGPRPHMVMHTEEYSKLIDKYMMRHFVKPGITGWSQVTGFRGETKELSQMEGRVRGDIYYLEHWSFWLDIYIIYKTVYNAVKGDEEAY